MGSLPTFDPGFSTEELTEIFSPGSTVAAMLEFETALALSLGDAGLAPSGEAQEVAAACRKGISDPDAVLAATWQSGTPLIGLREAVVPSIDSESARKWFHHGATSQDTIDTGRILQYRTALGSIDRVLSSIATHLQHLTADYRDQPHMGRTFLQDARPITFGFRTATWLDAVLAHIRELRRQRGELTIQLGGPVGTRDFYGEGADAMVSSVAQRLGLASPDISWHSDRTRVLSLAQAVERAAVTMGKIGSDLAILASSSVAEIRVRSGGSSSMPEKENPLDSIRSVAAARACCGAIAMIAAGTGHELDRGIGGWHVEWIALPLVFQTAGAAVEAIEASLASLQVDRDRMTANAGDGEASAGRDQIDSVLAEYDRVLG